MRNKINKFMPLLNFYKLHFVMLAILMCIALIVGSRALFIGYFMSIILLLLLTKPIQASLIKYLSLVFVGLLIFVTFFVKVDSTRGRIFIYKISYRILTDHYIKGIGLGNFGNIYCEYQASYFGSGDFTQKEVALADNTRHAFNDYFQWIIETGIIGFALLLTVLVASICGTRKMFRGNDTQSWIFYFFYGQLAAIVFAAIFTHIFERQVLQYLFIISLAIICYYNLPSLHSITAMVSIFIISLLIIYNNRSAIFLSVHYQKYKVAKSLFQAGYLKEAQAQYQNQFEYLKDDQQFLLDFATVEIALNNYPRAEDMLERCMLYNNGNLVQFQLADCYFANGKYKMAEHFYRNSINSVPNRFISRHKLLQFYLNRKQYTKAKQVAEEIILLPVKISSYDVNRIKANAKEIRNILISHLNR